MTGGVMMKSGISNQRGLTLTELMTALAILAVMAVMGMESFMGTLPRHRLNAAARDLVSDMHLARSRAVMENWQYTLRFISGSSYEIVRGDQPLLQSSGSMIPVITRSNRQAGSGHGEIRWNVPARMPVFHPDGLITSWDQEYGSFSIDLPEPVVLNNSHGERKTVTLSRFGRIKIQ